MNYLKIKEIVKKGKNMKDEYIKKFYEEVKQSLDGDYKIILEPGRKLKEDWIEYDQVKWEMDNEITKLVNELLKNKGLSFEEKILKVYEFICLNYVYDDNVLYFFRKDTSDINNIKYIAVDWYGRIVGEKWIENRKKHNRRICYEFARFYAKAINTLLDGNDALEAFMVGDKENLHYVVGLTGEEYSVILDLDDFNSIKDLTRVKLGLTIKGIRILRDKNGKMQNAIDKFNTDKKDELIEIEKLQKTLKNEDTIKYFSGVVDILRNYNIDSQGICEYTRALIENEGIEIEKIWKEVKDAEEKRYARCIIFENKGKTYLVDSVEKKLKKINKEELDKELFVFNPEENEYPYYGG